MQAPPDYVEVPLRDGRIVRVRPITAADGERLVRFHSTLSDRTIYQRYFAAHPRLTDSDVHRFTHVDHCDREAYVATVDEEIVAVGRWDRIDETQAEVAFVITDSYQRQGIGSLLFTLLATAARGFGISEFVAEVLPQNRAMIRLFQVFGEAFTRVNEEGSTFITVRLPEFEPGGLNACEPD